MAINFPDSPTNGQVFTSGSQSWTYYTTPGVWKVTSGAIGYTGSKGTTYIADTSPVSPVNGDTWFDSEEGIRYVYYADGTSSQWIQESTIGPRGYPGYIGSIGYTGSQGIIGYTGSASTVIGYTGSASTVIGYTGSRGPANIPQSGTDKTISYTLQASDIGTYIGVGVGGSIIITDTVFTNGDVVSICNNTTGNITITCNITTAYVVGVNTDRSSVTLATRGICSVLFISATSCILTGSIT